MANVTAGYNWTSGETVTPTKLNSTAAPTVVVADNEVTTSKILDGAVTNVKLATGIDASKITTGTLPIDRIADDAVTDAKLSLAANAGEIKKALNADNAPPIFACRAWVNFDGTKDSTGAASTANTNRLIRASGNVTSVGRGAAGRYVITFTTAMPDASYCVTGSTQSTNVRAGNGVVDIAGSNVTTTTSVEIRIKSQDSVDFDSPQVMVAIFR
jgi:hypothetical protein